MKCLKPYILAFTLLAGLHLNAVELGTELNLSGGYRHDHLDRRITSSFVPPAINAVDRIRVKNISIGQIGFDGRLMIPPADSHLDATFLNNFYIRGFAYWGRSGRHATLHETVTGFLPPREELGIATLKNVQTNDYQIGLGYLFACECWGLGISGGYAYNRQKLKSDRGQISFPPGPFTDAALFGKGYEIKTTWQGPWVGAELFYDWCAWLFTLGYEYHFTDYHLSHSVPENQTARIEGIADRARSSNASGNVVFLRGSYRFCDGWALGAYVKYQNWHAHARLKPAQGTFVEKGFPETTCMRATGRWISYSVTATIGYYF